VSHSQLEVERASEVRGQPTTGQRTLLVFRDLAKNLFLFVLAAVVFFILTRGAIGFLHSPVRGLPYTDRFANSNNAEWTAYGGNWKVEDGSMVNESNERGAKLVTGSPYWTDYTIQADIALRSAGDAGIIARVSDPEIGVDAYNGIYVGLRTRDQALVIGAADHDWGEYTSRALSTSISSNTWYHLEVRLENCNVDAIVTLEDSREMGRATTTIDSCPLRGRIGLRSYDSGGIWKHVRVTKLAASH
jgi:hypothetical protein